MRKSNAVCFQTRSSDRCPIRLVASRMLEQRQRDNDSVWIQANRDERASRLNILSAHWYYDDEKLSTKSTHPKTEKSKPILQNQTTTFKQARRVVRRDTYPTRIWVARREFLIRILNYIELLKLKIHSNRIFLENRTSLKHLRYPSKMKTAKIESSIVSSL